MPRPTDLQEGPEDRFNDPHAVCSLRPRPQIMTGMFRHLLGEHFANADKCEEPSLRNLYWVDSVPGSKANNPESKILIEPVLKYVADMTDLRPAIVIKREPWQASYPGINNNQMMGGNITGIETHMGICQGGHTFFCIAPDSMVEVLASEVYRKLWHEATKIRKGVPHIIRFQVAGADSPRPLTKSLKEFVVAISVQYAFIDTYDLIPQVPRLKRIQFKEDTECDQ